jgi:putative membrane protein
VIAEVLLAVHITGVVGWGGLSTGGYYVLKSCGGGCYGRYRRLVYLQFASALAVFATGLALAVVRYGFPRSPLWIHAALGIALAIGVVELAHLWVAEEGLQHYEKYVRIFIPLWTAGYLAMIYLMIFKPF